jgi:ATP dependent DNA ligase domain
MLAVLTEERFSSEEWIFERKLDGERCLAFRHGADVRLLSRTQQRLNDTYPELVEALLPQACDEFVVDGEVVAFEGPQTSFARLQQRMQLRDPERARRSGVRVFYYLFDLLHLDGRDVTGLPLRERKALLRPALAFADPVRYLAHRNAEGERFYREACSKGWEGLIAKRADSPYRHERSRDWLKFKCVNEQEFVIGRLHRSRRQAHRLRCAPRRLLRRSRPAALRRQGRGRLQRCRPARPRRAARPTGAGGAAVRGRTPTAQRGALGAAGARGADRLHRADRRRQVAPSPLPRAPARQASA